MSHAATLTPEVLTTLIALVRQHTGIAMTARKSVLLERRLQPRLRALSCTATRRTWSASAATATRWPISSTW